MAGDGNRRRAAAWNLVFGYSQIAVLVTRNILLVPVYLHFIDIAQYGAWIATAGVLAQLFVSDFGLTAAVMQRAAFAYGRDDRPLLAEAIGSSLAITTLLASVLTLLSMALAPLVPAVFGGDGGSGRVLLVSFLIVAAANGVGIIGLAATSLLRAMQRPVVSGVITLTSDLAAIGATIALLYAGHGLYALACGHAVRNTLIALSGLAANAWTWRRIPGLRPRWSIGEIRTMFTASYYQFFTSVTLNVQAKADVFFVGALIGPRAAAVYALSARAHETIQMLSGQVVASLDSSIAHLHGGRQSHRVREVLRVALTITALVGALGMAGVAALNEGFVQVWVGTTLFAGQQVSLVLAAAGFVSIVGYVPYIGLLARGDYRQVSHAYLISTIVQLLLLTLLTPTGLVGAAVASLTACLCRAGLLGASLRRELALPLSGLLPDIKRLLAVSLAPFVLALLVVGLAPPILTWTQFVLAVILFSLVAVILVWMIDRRLLVSVFREARISLGALGSQR